MRFLVLCGVTVITSAPLTIWSKEGKSRKSKKLFSSLIFGPWYWNTWKSPISIHAGWYSNYNAEHFCSSFVVSYSFLNCLAVLWPVMVEGLSRTNPHASFHLLLQSDVPAYRAPGPAAWSPLHHHNYSNYLWLHKDVMLILLLCHVPPIEQGYRYG